MRNLLDRELPRQFLINVNIPAGESLSGIKITRLGTRIYRDVIIKKVDPRGRDYYWIGGGEPKWVASPDTDFSAVSENHVSVTPLLMDLTDTRQLEFLQGHGALPPVMIARDYPQERENMVKTEVAGKGVTDEAVIRVMARDPPTPVRPPGAGARVLRRFGPAHRKGPDHLRPPDGGHHDPDPASHRHRRPCSRSAPGPDTRPPILSRLAAKVITVERLEPLARLARKRLEDLGTEKVEVVVADGSGGLPDRAPFDRILVTAATPRIADGLLEQLGTKGILVAPVGERNEQNLMRFIRQTRDFYKESICRCVFVPLLGREGFEEE